MFIGLVEGTSAIVGTWLVLIAAACGQGLLLRRLFGLRELDADTMLQSFWLGICVTVSALHLWNFIFPITWHILALTTAIGLLGLLWNRTALRAWMRKARPVVSPLLAISLIVIGAWIANRAFAACVYTDSGMYHLPTMTWAKTFPAVVGLGNLHGRLAFNNSSILYTAMVDHGVWAGRANHVVNSLFLFVMMSQIVMRFFQLHHADARNRARYIFDIVLAAPVIALARGAYYVSSLSPDVPAAVALFAAASMLFRVLTEPGPEKRSQADTFGLVVLVPLLTLCVCFKLSTLVFAAFAAVVGLAVFFRRWARPVGVKAIVWALTLSALLVVPWLGRSVVLSGYLLFPAAVPVPVSWQVPAEDPAATRAWIGHFARTYYSGAAFNGTPYGDAVLLEWRWLPPWIKSLATHPETRWQVTLPLALLVALVAVRIASRRRGRVPGAVPEERGWLLAGPILAALIFWFLTAPRPLFGFPLFWILTALVAAQWLGALALSRARLAGFLAIAAAIATLPIDAQVANAAITRDGHPLQVLMNQLLVPPGPDLWFQPTPTAELTTFVTTSGLTLYVPKEGNLCWIAPLPCTPHPSIYLRLRHGADLSSGFEVTGPWEQANWPNPSTRFLESWRQFRARSQRRR